MRYVCVCVSFASPAPSNNVIMEELKKKNVKILSEKVLLLLNRGGKRPLFVTVFMFMHKTALTCTLHIIMAFYPLLRWPRVYVQTHPTCTTLSSQVSAGCVCQQRDSWHLLQHWHDGDDRHCCTTNIWPFTRRQGEVLTPLPLSGFGDTASAVLNIWL